MIHYAASMLRRQSGADMQTCRSIVTGVGLPELRYRWHVQERIDYLDEYSIHGEGRSPKNELYVWMGGGLTAGHLESDAVLPMETFMTTMPQDC